MDPLTLLRDYIKGGRLSEVTIADDRVRFGDAFSYPKSSKSSYRSKQGKGDFYELESLLFYARHIGSSKFREYLRHAQTAKVAPVAFVDTRVGWAGVGGGRRGGG